MEIGIKVIPFNHKMRRARKRLGLTQYQLADLVGIDRHYITEIERFKFRRNMPVEKLVELATFLGLEPDDLFPDEMREFLGDIIVPFETVVNVDVGRLLPSPDTCELVIEKEMKEVVHRLLDCLSERDKVIIELRFGLNGNRTHTLAEIGEKLGVTATRVAQLEARALKKLRRPLRKRMLKDYLDS